MSFPLNPAQREAVRYLDGPLLVLAGAGSGKTRVIAAKIGHLIERGFDPKQIAAITFTNRAAREMRERAAALLAQDGQARPRRRRRDLHVSRAGAAHHPQRSRGTGPEARLLDPRSRRHRADRRRTDRDDRSRPRARGAVADQRVEERARFAACRSGKSAQSDDDSAAAQAYLRYDDTLRAYQAVDFDDLIALPIELLAADDSAASKWRERCAHLLVDEYQDTNPAQYRLFKLLVGDRGDFTVVGDDDQAIYGWRGASLDNLGELPKDYPRAQGREARAELPVDGAHPALGERADREQSEALREEPLERPWARRRDPRDAGGRRRGRGRRRRAPPAGAPVRASRPLRRLRDPLPRQPSGEALRAAAARARRSLRDLGRPVVLRAHGDQGPRRVPAPHRQRRRRSGVHPRDHDAEARRRRDDAGRASRRSAARGTRACSPPSSPRRRAGSRSGSARSSTRSAR